MRTSGFWHDALFYVDDDDFLSGTAPFVREGVEAGEPVLVAVPSARAVLLRDELDGVAEAVSFVDMEQLGRNPYRIISAWREFVRTQCGPGRPVRGIGEPIWAGRGAEEVVECQHHESLLNLAFLDDPPLWLRCPYDARALSDDVLDGARCSHPTVIERGHGDASPSYRPPHLHPSPFAGPLAPPPGGVTELTFDRDGLSDVRRLVADLAAAVGLPDDRAADLEIAVNELATNSIRHGGGSGRLLAWLDEGALFCEVRDGGRIVDPLTGRLRPPDDQYTGRGLWMVNHLCDFVQVRSGDAGTVVRAQMQLERRRPPVARAAPPHA